VKCYVRINKVGFRFLDADIVLMDSNRNVLMKLNSWEDFRFFDWTRQFHSFMLAPCNRKLSVSWPLPINQLSNSNRIRVSLFSEPGTGIWPRVLAHLILSRRERKLWSRLTGSEQRRQEWLVGRMAAKDSIRWLLWDLYQMDACPSDIEIFTNEHGQPVVSDDLNTKFGCRFSLSIAHSDKVTAAIVSTNSKEQQGIGIDIEKIDRNHEGIEEAGFTATERYLLDSFSTKEREKWALRFSCAKEAVAKALGRGMMGSPFNLAIQNVTVETGEVSLNITGQLAKEFPSYANMSLTAFTGCDETIVFATSVV
jgi:phosphopantetheine--protein transferase-like protein